MSVEHGNYQELETVELGEFSRDDYCDLLQVYLDAMPVTVATLEQGCDREDAGLAARALHKLKSNTAYVCFSDLPARCYAAEQRLKSESIVELGNDLQTVVSRCKTLLEEIQTFLAS